MRQNVSVACGRYRTLMLNMLMRCVKSALDASPKALVLHLRTGVPDFALIMLMNDTARETDGDAL